MVVWQLLKAAKEQLASSTSTPALDAEILLAHILQKPRASLHAWPDALVTLTEVSQFAACLERRIAHEPIAYITGHKEFWSLDIMVTKDTLIPRPETELLVEQVLRQLPGNLCQRVADLGTGSGAIALALAKECPAWEIVATDESQAALDVASKNAQSLELLNISFYKGNWCEALPSRDFNAIISNPPYIAETEWGGDVSSLDLAFEPYYALVSKDNGLDAIRTIAKSAKYHLQLNGWLLMEHGYWQAPLVQEILSQEGYQNVHSIADLAGHLRVTIGTWG